MRILFLTIVGMLVAGSSALASPPKAPADEMHICLDREAVSLDDGQEDPLAIGKIAVAECYDPIRKYVQSSDPSAGAALQGSVAQKLEKYLALTTAGFVLEWRKAERAHKP